MPDYCNYPDCKCPIDKPGVFGCFKGLPEKAMTEYQPTEQDRVLLDYAQTAQRRADPWVEFQMLCGDNVWRCCTNAVNPATGVCSEGEYRRKPRTVTLSYQGREWELPVPVGSVSLTGNATGVMAQYGGTQNATQWLAAMREIAGGEK